MLGSIQSAMRDRTKLIIVSLAVMMLPYRLDLPVALLVITAILCIVMDILIERCVQRQHFARNVTVAISLYRHLKYRAS
jgi:hypothetical protein